MKKMMPFVIIIAIAFSAAPVYAQQFQPGEVDAKGVIPLDWGDLIAVAPVIMEKM